jgi:hypothetical protein
MAGIVHLFVRLTTYKIYIYAGTNASLPIELSGDELLLFTLPTKIHCSSGMPLMDAPSLNRLIADCLGSN